MPSPQRPTSAGTADPGAAAPLSADEQAQVLASDTADVSPRAEAPNLSGKRVRAIPAVITKSGDNATTVEVRKSDFAAKGIDHPTVVFDYRKDNYTVGVGDGAPLSQEAADFLTKNYPVSFEYMNEG